MAIMSIEELQLRNDQLKTRIKTAEEPAKIDLIEVDGFRKEKLGLETLFIETETAWQKYPPWCFSYIEARSRELQAKVTGLNGGIEKHIKERESK